MTLQDAITKIDTMKPNVYSQSDKIAWLSTLDGMIYRDVISKHEGGEYVTFQGYTDDTDMETELLVPAPFDDMYIVWLESKIDYSNSEYIKYNNSITRYNDIYQGYANDYNRSHMPLGTKIRYW